MIAYRRDSTKMNVCGVTRWILIIGMVCLALAAEACKICVDKYLVDINGLSKNQYNDVTDRQIKLCTVKDPKDLVIKRIGNTDVIPPAYYQQIKKVKVFSKEGDVLIGYCGTALDDYVDAGVLSTPSDVHQGYHRGASYFRSNIYIGREQNAKLIPTLAFYDVGMHRTAPFDIAIDPIGRVHLAVTYVEFGGNRAHIYYLTSNPTRTTWMSVTRLFFSTVPCAGARVRLAVVDGEAHIVWYIRSAHSISGESGIFYAHATRGNIDEVVQLVETNCYDLDVAVGFNSNDVMIAFRTSGGVGVGIKCDESCEFILSSISCEKDVVPEIAINQQKGNKWILSVGSNPCATYAVGIR